MPEEAHPLFWVGILLYPALVQIVRVSIVSILYHQMMVIFQTGKVHDCFKTKMKYNNVVGLQ